MVKYIVTNMTIAKQQFGKHIPDVKQSTVEGSRCWVASR
jgi:hypothetical protein